MNIALIGQTLHDLMDESELDSLTPPDSNRTVASASRKRRDLEESMRREAEERQKRKRELMRREKEYEKVSHIDLIYRLLSSARSYYTLYKLP